MSKEIIENLKLKLYFLMNYKEYVSYEVIAADEEQYEVPSRKLELKGKVK